MTPTKLDTTLREHKLWLYTYGREGKRGNLRGANLAGANLRGANLECADLRGANLRGANLWYAYLQDAYLQDAYLQDANLEDANLWYANLAGADLRGAYLEGADLAGADLRHASLRGANIRSADLRGADLRGTDLEGAYLEGAKLPHFQICPQEGSFVAYKKTTEGVVKLLVPEDAERTSSLVGRKCRASKVVVLEGSGFDLRTGQTEYRQSETVYPDKYDPDIRVECTHGIHFFMTRQEAEEWY